jgi:hypothetical protein
MFGRNVDFAAVLSISLVMLGMAWVQSWHWADALDSIRVEKAIRIERCPLPREIFSSLSAILHH